CTVTRPLIIFQISCRISCWDVSPTNRSFPERLISAGARSPTAAICIGSLLTCHSATGPTLAEEGRWAGYLALVRGRQLCFNDGSCRPRKTPVQHAEIPRSRLLECT